MKKKNDIHSKAIRLIEGGSVEINGLWVRMVRVPQGFDVCMECKMDSLCVPMGDIYNVCTLCDDITGQSCLLKLNNQKSLNTTKL